MYTSAFLSFLPVDTIEKNPPFPHRIDLLLRRLLSPATGIFHRSSSPAAGISGNCSPHSFRRIPITIDLHLDQTICFLSESRNPFVEYAVQYSIAAAYATLDKNKKNELQKLLLQAYNVWILQSWVAMKLQKLGECLPNLDTYNILTSAMFVRKRSDDKSNPYQIYHKQHYFLWR
ncbi:hypothetical protein L2E82_20565 [Cichorium intybus]|uniref:Uncharacterized protein n=1 Tax=Cichorium intybus TaxID=13427 RepID=A0ACB9DTG0_CICIN|nr:hypothetical protein L2E82_20565 [Cichorium intybus]